MEARFVRTAKAGKFDLFAVPAPALRARAASLKFSRDRAMFVIGPVRLGCERPKGRMMNDSPNRQRL